MRMATGQLESRDKDDTIRRLPTNMTKSGCYRAYGKENHFKLTRETGGGFIAVWEHSEKPEPAKGEVGSIVSWAKYLSFWDEYYSYLKVGKPSEDVCSHCWKWSMKHKFSLANSQLFLIPSAIEGS